MFDYVNRLQLALSDTVRRSGMKAAAAVALLIGLGFLIAALWSWLAWDQQLGPAMASLIVGGGFALIGLILWLAAGRARHPMPTPDELKHEVEARLSLAADVALDKVRFRAEEAMDSAQARVAGLFGGFGGSVRRRAEQAQDVAGKASEAAAQAAERVGLTGDTLEDAKESVDQALKSRAAPAVGLAGAFAVGMAIASALRGRHDKDDFYYDDDADWRR